MPACSIREKSHDRRLVRKLVTLLDCSALVLYDRQGWVASLILGDLIICSFLGDIMNSHDRLPWSFRQSVVRGAPRDPC